MKDNPNKAPRPSFFSDMPQVSRSRSLLEKFSTAVVWGVIAVQVGFFAWVLVPWHTCDAVDDSCSVAVTEPDYPDEHAFHEAASLEFARSWTNMPPNWIASRMPREHESGLVVGIGGTKDLARVAAHKYVPKDGVTYGLPTYIKHENNTYTCNLTWKWATKVLDHSKKSMLE